MKKKKMVSISVMRVMCSRSFHSLTHHCCVGALETSTTNTFNPAKKEWDFSLMLMLVPLVFIPCFGSPLISLESSNNLSLFLMPERRSRDVNGSSTPVLFHPLLFRLQGDLLLLQPLMLWMFSFPFPEFGSMIPCFNFAKIHLSTRTRNWLITISFYQVRKETETGRKHRRQHKSNGSQTCERE